MRRLKLIPQDEISSTLLSLKSLCSPLQYGINKLLPMKKYRFFTCFL
jgi:hypothetical protein